MKKLPFKRRPKAAPSRITNETVAEHRERILAGGRRFKYPMQYARHRLVFNTILVAIVALILLVAIGWQQLYVAQNTGTFLYRVTRVLPLPVASVDGQDVRYSDYLMYYNSSIQYLVQNEQINLQSADGKRQVNYYKAQSLDDAIADAYALKLAPGLHVTVTQQQVDQVVSNDRNTANGRISQETYDASVLSVLGWSPAEYRHNFYNKLVRQEVSYKIDTTAQQQVQKATTLLAQPNADFDTVASELGGTGDGKVTAGVSGYVPLNNQDGGLSIAAAKLQKGQVSAPIETTTADGYYFVKLIDINSTQLSYAYIRIPLTTFNDQLAALKKAGKIHEYITIPAISNQ